MTARATKEQRSSPLPDFNAALNQYGQRDFAIRLWDGSEWPAETNYPAFTIVFRNPQLMAQLADGALDELSLCESFVAGDIDIEGDLVAATRLADIFVPDNHLSDHASPHRPDDSNFVSRALAAQCGMIRPGQLHSPQRDRQAIAFHYNVSNEFYALWLDQRMMYSTARFSNEGEDLDAAQTNRLARLCRKLHLKAGDHLLDIGCGWGGVILYATRQYGAISLGITLSEPQAELANRRAQVDQLDNQCRAIVCDYRELKKSQPFDKIISTGMVEHVGNANLPDYFRRAYDLLRPGGTFVLSGIAASLHYPPADAMSFIRTYVFPNGELVPIHRTFKCAEEAGFEVLDAENLQDDYALTLRHWVHRLEEHHQQALHWVDERTYRIWRLYMASSAFYFAMKRLNVFEIVLAKPKEGVAR